MRPHLRLTIIFLLFPILSPAQAKPPQIVLARAMGPAVGCKAPNDLRVLLTAGALGQHNSAAANAKIQALAKLTRQKLDSAACFAIRPGQLAYSSFDWNKPQDLAIGIAIFKAHDGTTFYSPAWVWRGIQNVTPPSWVKPN